jgi:hypothetical protein
LTKTNATVVPHPTYFSLFPQLKIKVKVRHFLTTEETEAESHAELNTLAEYDFQDTVKKMAEEMHVSGRGLFQG